MIYAIWILGIAVAVLFTLQWVWLTAIMKLHMENEVLMRDVIAITQAIKYMNRENYRSEKEAAEKRRTEGTGT